MALQGDVSTIPVRELLGWLAGRRASGTLSLSRGKTTVVDLAVSPPVILRQGRGRLPGFTVAGA